MKRIISNRLSIKEMRSIAGGGDVLATASVTVETSNNGTLCGDVTQTIKDDNGNVVSTATRTVACPDNKPLLA